MSILHLGWVIPTADKMFLLTFKDIEMISLGIKIQQSLENIQPGLRDGFDPSG